MIFHVVFSFFILLILSGCISQSSAPIEYNYARTFTNYKLLQSQLLRPNVKEFSTTTRTIEDDQSEIINKPLNIKERDFERTVGLLKAPMVHSHSQDSDDIIIVPQVKLDNNKTIYHEVQKGETLELIAKNYDQVVEELAELNNLSPSYHLNESQIIQINISNKLLNKKNKENANHVLDHSQQMSKVNQTNKLKCIKPVEGTVITNFGTQTSYGQNKGINIAATNGSAVKSIAAGIVVYVGYDVQFGNLLIVKLDNCDLYAAYAHLQNLILQKGVKVAQNTVLGHIGQTGNVTRPQLHFAIREGQMAVDPFKYIPN